MKKVTVKHYLNTNINVRELSSNGEYLNDKIFHPVYVQISFARKTTQIRSYTEISLTDEDYEYYKSGDYDKMTDVQKIKKYLVPEPKRIQTAIEYLLNRRENDNNKDDILLSESINKFDDIRYDVEHLIEPMQSKLIEYGWAYLAYVSQQWLKESNTIDIHNVFNLNHSLLENLDIIKRVTGYDLAPFFSQKELIFWNNVDLLIKRYANEEYSFIDFIENYEILVRSVNEIKDDNEFIKEIKELIYYTT